MFIFQLHFIFRHRNPKNGTFEEKHCKKPKDRLNEPFEDKKPHLYTLIIKPDNSFEIRIDHKVSIDRGNRLDWIGGSYFSYYLCSIR